jgi:hypothetical protein
MGKADDGKQGKDKSGKGKRENWLLIKRSDTQSSAGAPADSVARDRSVSSGRTMRQIANSEPGERQHGSEARQVRGSRESALPRRPRAQLATADRALKGDITLTTQTAPWTGPQLKTLGRELAERVILEQVVDEIVVSAS